MKPTSEDMWILTTSVVMIVMICWGLIIVLTSCSVRILSPGNDDADRRYMTIEDKK